LGLQGSCAVPELRLRRSWPRLPTKSGALQLRYLQTLTEISVEKNSTIIFPLPIDLAKPFMQVLEKNTGDSQDKWAYRIQPVNPCICGLTGQ